MFLYPKFNFNDSMGWYRRYNGQQYYVFGVDDAAMIALAAGSTAQGAGSLISGLSSSDKPSIVSTFSGRQRMVDRLIYDFFMGNTRDSKGNVVSSSPILTRMQQKGFPQLRKAPFTAGQQQTLGMAKAMIPQIQNMRGLDNTSLDKLAKGILPTDKASTNRYMVKGGILPPGGKATVGEDGVEKITALPGGGVIVEPNPKTQTKEGMSKALKKMARVQKKTGLPGMATGNPYWQFTSGDNKWWIPTTGVPSRMSGWSTTDAWAKPLQEAFESSVDLTALPKYNAVVKEYGGYGNVPLTKKTTQGDRDWNSASKEAKALNAYWGAFNDWYEQQSEGNTQYYNPDLADPMANVKREDIDTFVNWMNTTSGNPYNSQMVIGDSGNWEFANSFDMTPEKLSAAVDYFYTKGPGYQEPETPAYDYSTLAGQIGAGNSDDFNQFLQSYQGGALSNYSINLNPTTDQQEFGTYKNGVWTPIPSNVAPGMEGAITAYGEQKAAQQAALNNLNGTSTNQYGPGASNPTPGPETGPPGPTTPETSPETGTESEGTTAPITFTNADLVKDAQGNWVPDPDRFEQKDGVWQAKTSTADTVENMPEDIMTQLMPLIMGVAGGEFDPAKYEKEFETGVADPTWRQFEKHGRPGIRETYAGGEMFGSAREKAEQSAMNEIEYNLGVEQSKYVAGERDSYEVRQQNAITQAMNLAQLPSSLADAKASIDIKKATAANIFSNIEFQRATTEANLSYLDIQMINTIWSIMGDEQAQEDAQLLIDYQNAMTEDGLNLSALITALNQYQDRTAQANV